MRLYTGLILGIALFSACGVADADKDGFDASIDCNDDNASIHPNATEVCDGVDNNCDGFTDDATADDAPTWYADADGDTYGGDVITLIQCDAPEGFVAEANDCDDLDATTHPEAAEVCDGLDNDCDGLVDGDDDGVDTATYTTFYADTDEDGYGTDLDTVEACSAPSGYVSMGGDCDDEATDINPETVWYADLDDDGYGGTEFVTVQCEQPEKHTADAGDCADLDPAIHPDATEICDSLDNDCDDDIDDADDSVDSTTFSTWYLDYDTDTYGDATVSVEACAAPEGYVGNDEDCDDGAIEVNPDATEVCEDGIDNNCDGSAIECALSATAITDADYTLTGEASGDDLGISNTMLDLNGDGYADIVLGAPDADDSSSDSGTVSVFYGPLSADADTSDADVNWTGEVSYDELGGSVASAGDVNNDGYDDLLVSTTDFDGDAGSYTGRVYLVMGSATAFTGGTITDLGLIRLPSR